MGSDKTLDTIQCSNSLVEANYHIGDGPYKFDDLQHTGFDYEEPCTFYIGSNYNVLYHNYRILRSLFFSPTKHAFYKDDCPSKEHRTKIPNRTTVCTYNPRTVLVEIQVTVRATNRSTASVD